MRFGGGLEAVWMGSGWGLERPAVVWKQPRGRVMLSVGKEVVGMAWEDILAGAVKRMEPAGPVGQRGSAEGSAGEAASDGSPLTEILANDLAEERADLHQVASVYEGDGVGGASYMTASQGLEMVRGYFLSGNLKTEAMRMGIRYEVAKRASRELWWQEELAALEREAKLLQRAKLSGMLTKAMEELEDRLENGDQVLVKSKDGAHLERVPLGGRDLAVIASTLFEKRSALEDGGAGKGPAPLGRVQSLAEKLRAVGSAGNQALAAPGALDTRLDTRQEA